MAPLPYDASAPVGLASTFAHMGGRYTIGAMRMCDCPAGRLRYRFPADGDRSALAVRGRMRPEFRHGRVVYDTGFEFPVSSRGGPRALNWLMTVAKEPDGTVAIFLTEGTALLAEVREVGDDRGLCSEIIRLHQAARV